MSRDGDEHWAQPRISVQLLAPVARWLARARLPVDDLLADIGLSMDALGEHDRLVLLADYVAFFEVAAQAAREPHLGLLLGRVDDEDKLGALGHLFMSSPSLLQAFAGFNSHLCALQEGTTNRLRMTAERVRIDYHIDDERIHRRRQDSEYSIAASVNLARRYSGGAVRPREIWFEHGRVGDYGVYRDYFDCDVFFDQARNVVLFDRDGFDVRATHGSVLNPIIAMHLHALRLARSGEDGLVGHVRAQIADGLLAGQVSQRHVSRALGMSVPTLARKLRARGHAFRDLVSQERMAIAERLLVATDEPIARIAQATGYAENASFTRAFRRARGVNPLGFRRRRAGAE